MRISGYEDITVEAGGPQVRLNFNVADSLTWSVGRHVIKFGGELRTFNRFNGLIPEGTYGNFRFNGSTLRMPQHS